MKTTDAFKMNIKGYLEDRAKTDKLFAVNLAKEGKNIDDCINYIMNTVKASECSGFTDDEIYGMAVHYYDEDDVKAGAPIRGRVVVNHQVEISEEDRKKAKEEAKERVIKEEMGRMKGKNKEVKVIKEDKDLKVVQTSLF